MPGATGATGDAATSTTRSPTKKKRDTIILAALIGIASTISGAPRSQNLMLLFDEKIALMRSVYLIGRVLLTVSIRTAISPDHLTNLLTLIETASSDSSWTTPATEVLHYAADLRNWSVPLGQSLL